MNRTFYLPCYIETNINSLNYCTIDDLTEVNELMLHNGTNPLYKVYKIKQGKTGKVRQIEEPIEPLKRIQKEVSNILSNTLKLHSSCMAKPGSSAIKNAKQHEGAKHLLKIDLKNCYHNITEWFFNNIAIRSFEHNLYGKNFDMWKLVETMKYHSYNHRLPTGAPTSPILCNIALTPLDYDIVNLLNTYDKGKYTYTRYLDDIIISTKDNKDKDLKGKVEKLIKSSYNLPINRKKSKWMRPYSKDKCVVTGVTIKENNTVARQFIRMMRARLQNIAVAGKDLDPETQGCLSYVKSVDPNKHQKLLNYFEKRKLYESSRRECVDSK